MFGACEDHEHEDYPDLEEEMDVDEMEGSCNQVQVNKGTSKVSALALIMDELAITSLDDISLADNE